MVAIEVPPHPLQMRPLEPEDLPRIAGLFEQLSPESRYLRFFNPVPKIPRATIERLAAIDHDGHEAIGVFERGELVGAAHYHRDAVDRDHAEIAIEVDDAHQRHGLGKRLLAELAHVATERGITVFTATALGQNDGIRALLRGRGWPTTAYFEEGELHLTMALPDRSSQTRSARPHM